MPLTLPSSSCAVSLGHPSWAGAPAGVGGPDSPLPGLGAHLGPLGPPADAGSSNRWQGVAAKGLRQDRLGRRNRAKGSGKRTRLVKRAVGGLPSASAAASGRPAGPGGLHPPDSLVPMSPLPSLLNLDSLVQHCNSSFAERFKVCLPRPCTSPPASLCCPPGLSLHWGS